MTQLLQILPPSGKREAPGGFALWRLGFRPFYLLGALYAALGVPLWIAMLTGVLAPVGGMPPMVWHAHEMVYGFAVAIVIGFLFTAVRNWTNLPTPTGAKLAGFCVLWLAARLAWLLADPTVALAIEVALLALVAASLLSVLVKAGSRRNYFVGVLFAVLALVDLLFWAAVTGRLDGFGALDASRLALDLIVLLTFVIGGRVIPMFTLNMVRGLKQFKDVRLDRAAIAASVLAFALDLAGVPGVPMALAALAAGVLHALRLGGWGPQATLRKPILWILHAGYGWAVIGFLLMAAAALDWVPRALAIHAFSTGAVGGLIIGMVTRTALGHTGRMLIAGKAETAMYALVMLAAVFRVFGPLLFPAAYTTWMTLGAVAWSTGFLLYAVVYAPRLMAPRVDGREG